MEITIGQQLYYSNREWVPVKDIGESLLALESTIQQSVPILEKLIPGTQIESVQVFINELKSDSIYEDLVVKFVFGSQEQLDEFIADSRKKLGMDKLMANPNIYAVLLIAMLLGALAYEMGKDSGADAEQKATIEASHNTIINIGAGMTDMQAGDFRALIDGAMKDKSQVARDAVAIIRPAKRDPQASIRFNGEETLSLSSDDVKAAPNSLKEPEPEELIRDFTDIQLDIRATDLDSGKKGWAAALPDFDDRRVRLQLDPSVKPSELASKRSVRGSVTIVFKTDKKGNQVPVLVFLRSLFESDDVAKISNPR